MQSTYPQGKEQAVTKEPQTLAIGRGESLDDARRSAVARSWAHLIAGGLGGMSAAFVTSPLDVIKTRLQSEFYRTDRKPRPAVGHFYSQPILRSFTHIQETFQILFAIPKVEGWRSLFKGLGPNLVGVVPASAIKFYAYSNGKHFISQNLNNGNEAAWVHLLAAAFAGIATSTATNPIWLVKTRLQLDKNLASQSIGSAGRKYKNSFDCVRQVVREEGVRGLYRGLSASYLGVTESTLHWILYEQIKLRLNQRKERLLRDGNGFSTRDDLIDWGGTVGGAACSKLFAAIITYPHEVVRTRLRQAPTENGRSKYTGLVQSFRLIWRQEGFVAFYGGLTPHLLRTVPSTAIMFGVYELVMYTYKTRFSA